MRSVKFRSIIFTIVIISSSLTIQAESRRDIRGDQTINSWSRYTKLEIQVDQSSYQPGAAITLAFRIKNTGYQVTRIYPNTKPGRSFRFMVLDKNGREMRPRIAGEQFPVSKHTIVNLTGDPIKEIILHPGETFEKNIRLDHSYSLLAGDNYRIVGYFWPDVRNKEIFIRSSNELRIHIKKHRRQIRSQNNVFNQNQNEPIISPEETIYLFLSAEMRKNWKNYLKYIDMKRYITSYDRFSSRYVQSTKTEKSAIIEEFRQFLVSSPADPLRKFKITQTDPERNSNGQVAENGRHYIRAIALRSENGFSARYEYKYTLEKFTDKNNTYWKIIYVEASLKHNRGNS